jgi:WD repeat-containing protein 48
MTLATLRAYVWKNGGDVILYYKSNGRKASVEKLINKENGGDLPKLNGMPAMTT